MILILLILYIYEYYSMRTFRNKYLNLSQWNIIKRCIINPKTDVNMRNNINKIIYFYYDDWSYYKALEFKKFHNFKCNHIQTSELYLYSNKGLLKAIKNYNGKSNFTKYAEIYVNGELYKGLTELYPITIISKRDRYKKQNVSNIELIKRQQKMKTTFVGYDEWLYEKLKMKNNFYNYKNYWEYNYENYEEFWEKINLLTPFERYLIHSKFDYFLKIKESNNYLAKKFGYSEEYIRITIINAIKKLLKT